MNSQQEPCLNRIQNKPEPRLNGTSNLVTMSDIHMYLRISYFLQTCRNIIGLK